MAYAFIHGEVKGSGASVEFKGNGLDLLDLTIQIVGSVVAEGGSRTDSSVRYQEDSGQNS